MNADTRLIGHWPLAGNTDDVAGANHGKAESVTYTTGPNGQPNGAAEFNGTDSFIQIEDKHELRLGTNDFTLSAWVRCESTMTHMLGDIVSKFDTVGRTGLNIHVAGSSPAYSSMSDQRHVHFGIDDGYIGEWQDCGKPEPSNSLVTTIATWQGDMYAGIADADTPEKACHVFRYKGEQSWEDCGRVGKDHGALSVTSMLVHDDVLYAGSGNWDWAKAEDEFPGFTPSKGYVYAYQGGMDWRNLGDVGNSGRVISLGSFAGNLYAGLDKRGEGKVFRYDGTKWIDCGTPDGKNVESFLPCGGFLYAATHGSVYRYDGDRSWTSICNCPFGINQIHTMTEIAGKLWIGTWPQGYVLRQDDSGEWINAGRLGIPEGLTECNEVMDLRVYNGKIYAGLIPKSQIWRYETDGHWTLMTSLASRPDYDHNNKDTWCRITSLNAFKGKLFAATGTCWSRAEHQDEEDTLGRVHGFTAGQVCSHENDIGGKWTHITAVRQGKETRLYIDGTCSATSHAPSKVTFDLTNTSPLFIAYGSQTYFKGAISDLRIYDGVLSDDAILSNTER
ncbi:MAG: LamG domain-containing protein [Lentisphaeria bacterium]|nr:LamG domain-containing protein [Lentisphaeria bacterium]NQZ71370.1 LamG domain-containing protein [Lentisphaeria bacterium]